MIRTVRALAALVFILAAGPVFAGGSWPIYGGAAFSCDGPIQSNALGGVAAPLFSNTTDRCCYALTEIPSFCAAAPTLTAAFELKQLDGTTAEDSVTMQIAVTALPEGSDGDEADWTYDTLESVAEDLADCDTATGSGICLSAPTAGFEPRNMTTGAACTGGGCSGATAVAKFCRDVGLGGDSATSVYATKIKLACD